MARSRRTSSTKRGRSSASQKTEKARRAKIVWGSLLASMTVVGGLLLALDGKPAPRLDGFAMAPLVASGSQPAAEAIFRTREPLNRSNWTSIVIHHSGSTNGSAATIAAEHEARNFKGLGHHFVIGNGNGMIDGDLFIGFRWLDQLPGAHASGARGQDFNLHAISICLVGDGSKKSFTPAQMKRLVQVVGALCREFRIPRDKVYLHSDIAPTDDPGPLFPEAQFRRELLAQ